MKEHILSNWIIWKLHCNTCNQQSRKREQVNRIYHKKPPNLPFYEPQQESLQIYHHRECGLMSHSAQSTKKYQVRTGYKGQ